MAPSSVNVLSASSLSAYIASSLPKDASPQLKNSTDAVAIACHSGMLAVGFRLVGLGEDDRIEAHSDNENTEALPTQWNASSAHAFRYKHSQSSMEYLLKISRLGNKTVVYGIGMGDDKTTSFDITTKDYISESSLPTSPTSSSSSPEDTVHSIQNIFISPSRLTDLGALLRINILQKLVPGLQKEGYEESSQTSTASTQQQQSQSQQTTLPPPRRPTDYDPLRDDPLLPNPARPHPLADPSFAPRRPPHPTGDFPPPDFEDPYDLNRPPRGIPRPGDYNPSIGERDLYPQGMGPNDPLRIGGVGPGLRGGGPSGGMHPSFDDPLFAGRGGGGDDDFFNPQVPPGARYDPLGPGDGPRRGAGGRMGGPGFGGGFGGGGGGFGGPPNPFGGFGGGNFI